MMQGVPNNDINRRLGEIWRNLAPEREARFVSLAEEDKLRYLKVCIHIYYKIIEVNFNK